MRKFLILCLFELSLLAGSISIPATVVSTSRQMVGAKYMGYVKNIYYDIGDRVKEGALLYELESAEFDIIKEQVKTAIEEAELMVDVYRKHLKKIKKEKKEIEEDEYNSTIDIDLDDLDEIADRIKTSLKESKELTDATKRKMKELQTLIDYLQIKAPTSGIIVEKQIEKGDLIYPGMLTMVIIDLKHLELQADIAASDIYRIEEGQKVDIYIPSLDYKTVGWIKAIVPGANPMTHIFKIRVAFKYKNHNIFPGMYAKIDIKYSDK